MPSAFEDFLQLCTEFRVRVVDEVCWHLLLLRELHADLPRLFGNPSGILVPPAEGTQTRRPVFFVQLIALPQEP